MAEKKKKKDKELLKKKKWEKIPVPKISEGKEFLRPLKKEKKEEKTVEEVVQEEKEWPGVDLETLAREEIELPPEIVSSEYTQKLSEQPVEELKQDVVDIYNAAKERGYMTQEEERQVEYTLGAVERKKTSGYSFTKETALAASITQQVGATLMKDFYKY